MSNVKNNIIDSIMYWMTKRGISAYKLAKECNIKSANITQWKQFKQKPSIDALIRIADYLNLSLDCLCGRILPQIEDMQVISNDLTNKYYALTDIQKAKIEERIDYFLSENKLKEINKSDKVIIKK